MHFKKFLVPIFTILILACQSFAVSTTDQTCTQNASEYVLTDFPAGKLDLDLIHLENCQACVKLKSNLFAVSCRESKNKSQNDDGLKLYLIEKTKDIDKPVIRYQSKCAEDSYYMHLSVFKKVNTDNDLIILAETGAEFSYGIGVYWLQNMQMTYVGELDVTVDEDNTPSSAVAFTKIFQYDDQLIFTFTKDVLILQNNGDYKKINKNRLRYQYKAGKLEKIEMR